MNQNVKTTDETSLARKRMINTILSGSAGGIASIIVCHPLDTIRTRLQTSMLSNEISGVKYRGALDCFNRTIKEEGFRALYRGLSAPLSAQALYKAVMFGSFSFARETLIPSINSTFGLSGAALGNNAPLRNIWLYGCFAGMVNSFVVTPVELIRNRLMIHRGLLVSNTANTKTSGYYGVIECVKQTYFKEGGIFGFWRGLSSTLLRDGPGVGVWFTSFELAKRNLPTIFGWAPDSSANLLISGACGGVGFWLVALPFDAIKSHIQTTVSGERNSILSIARRVGIRGLYTGLGVAIVRGIPGAGIVFLVQTKTLKYLESF